jgi:N6-adenosine-specific RNA methylase IME4/ParB-like chromosome segregation protein Spo0J
MRRSAKKPTKKPAKAQRAKAKRHLALPPATAKRHTPKPLPRSPVTILAADWLDKGARPMRELLQATLPLKAIKVGDRHRKEFGDIAALARDINERGLLQPIVVDRNNKLIAGERRLEAWALSIFRTEPIPVHVVPLKDIVSGEWAENDPALRKDFTPSEGVAIKQAIEAELKPLAAARARRKGAQDQGRAGDKAAAFTGKSRRTLEKAEEIVKAAQAEPEKFGALKDAMDKSGRVDGPHKRLKNMQAAEQIRAEPAPLPDNGPYRGAVIDIPWAGEPDAEEARDDRGYYPYPTMTTLQAVAFVREHVTPRLHADCVVGLWITNFHLAQGHHVPIIAALEGRGVTILTGRKDKLGRGQVARGTTEHVVIVVRGKPTIETFPRTDFEFAVDHDAHSRKPQSFYEMFERAVAAPRYASFFETTLRGGKWDCHGNAMKDAARPPASAAASAGKGGKRSRGPTFPTFCAARKRQWSPWNERTIASV